MRRICFACVCCLLLSAAVAWGSTLGPQPRGRSRSARMSAIHVETADAARSRSIMFGHRVVAHGSLANRAGVAHAFPFRSGMTGMVSSINIYLDRRSHSSDILAGVYRNAHGRPGSRVTDGSDASPVAGAWNSIRVAPAKIRAGSTYWLVVLGRGGALYLRRATTARCATSYQKQMTSLPAAWSGGSRAPMCFPSAYVQGKASLTHAPLAPTNLTPIATSGSVLANSGTGASGSTNTSSTPTNAPPLPPVVLPPVSLGPPAISGTPEQGQMLTTSDGAWLDSPTHYGYEWEDCDSSGSNCSAISGATSASYALTGVDVGHTIRSVVTASNSAGSASSTSAQTPVVTALPAPGSTSAPSISGSAVQGQTLSASHGSWSNSPTSYAYQWQDCNGSGSGCGSIAGATSSAYTLQASDVGDTIRVVVTATNAGGSGSATSGATAVVASSGGAGGGGGGTQLFLSQNGGGSGSGADCADAKPVSFFNTAANWGSAAGKIGPGVTVDLCGTISSPLTVQGSGVSGSPVTVFWEPGATLSAPDWTGSGAINTNGNSYITLDGGNNGTSIQATADGTGMADQGVASKGISASRCNGCTFENLTIANLYVHTSTSDASVDQTSDNAIKWSGSNVTVADNTVHDVGWALWFSGGTGDTNEQIYGNNVYNIDHGIIIAPPATSIGNVFVFANHIHDLANWDCGGGCHHDPIHCFGSENGVLYSGFYIYDNLFDGSWGSATSSATFIEGNFGSPGDTPCAASGSSVWIFNNISKPSDQMGCCGQLGNAAGGTGGMFNNMARGPSNTQNVGECMGYSASSNGSTAFFENNIMDNCDFLINGAASSSGRTTGTYAAGTPDYDAYVNGGSNAFSTYGPNGANCTFMPFSAFSSWKSCMGGVESHGNAFATEATAGINSSGSLTSGSPLIGAGNNLTTTCNAFPTSPTNVRAACETTYTGPPSGGGAGSATPGSPRPSSGSWDVGPY